MNLLRGFPLVSVAAALLIAVLLQWSWIRAGRPRGIAQTLLRTAK